MPAKSADRVLRDLGRKVAELRQSRGWTQAELAERVGVGEKYLQTIEAGRENLTVRSLVRIARVLGTDLHGLTEEPARRSPRRPGRPKKKPRE